MKVCIIGGSGHYRYALEGMDPDMRLVGIAPGSEGESLEGLGKALANLNMEPPRYDDYITMLDREKPDIAVVNPHFCDNSKVAIDVLSRGIHAFVEKPVATELDDLEKLKEIYSKSDLHLAAMFGIRYAAHFRTAWEAVRQGRIGKVRLMTAQKSYRLGERSDFFKTRKTYGGTIPWVGSHAIDWLHWFSGEEFQAVYATHSSLYNREHGDLEVSALCQFKFSNEVMGSVNIDYLRPQNAPSHDDDRIRVAGTKGVIEVYQGKVYLINDEKQGIQKLELLPEGQIFKDFVGKIRGEGDCIVTAKDSFDVTEACLKARMSADTGKVIEF
mgnify:FL=1